MKITVIQPIGYCLKCNAELVETRDVITCPNRKWWNRGHYFGDTGGYGIGSVASCKRKEIEVPDAPDSSWIPVTINPEVSVIYETLNTLTGSQNTLLCSASGGWWLGTTPWLELITHWRPVPK